MNKPTVGLALGGGGAKGWAHIGIINALAKQGIVPDVISGTSIGALVGGAYASGQLAHFEQWVRELRLSQVMGLLDVRFSGGLIQGDKVFNELGRSLEGVTFEGLNTPFGAVATDLERGTEVWLREGDLISSIRASAALPGLLSPAKVNGQWLVDGGLVNPIPVSMCRALGADFVIAVDLNSSSLPRSSADDSDAEAESLLLNSSSKLSVQESFSQGFGIRDKFYDLLEDMVGKLTSSPKVGSKVPSMVDVAVRSINIMSIRIARSRLAGDPPDILLTPQTGDIGLMEFHKGKEGIAIGEKEMKRQSLEITALRAALEASSL